VNVRIMPRQQQPGSIRRDLYGGVVHVHCDGETLRLFQRRPPLQMLGPSADLRLSDVAEILLDEEPGDWW
jgi:hypothetical protein